MYVNTVISEKENSITIKESEKTRVNFGFGHKKHSNLSIANALFNVKSPRNLSITNVLNSSRNIKQV